MAKQTRREIYITCNGKSAADMIKTLTQHAADLDAQIKKLIADGKGETKECKELVSVRRQLGKQLKENVSDTKMIDKVTRNLANSSTKQLRAALAAVRREIERTSESSGKLPQLRKQFEMLKNQIDKNTGAVNKQGGAWKTAAKNLVAYVGLFGAFNMLKQKLTDIINLNLKYSDSLANIRKITNWSMDSVEQLSNKLSKLDTRTSLEGLTQLAYVGSRMGIGKYGVEGLAEFAKASDRVNVALKEDLGDDAMLTLSKFVETMGEVEKHGGNVSDAFDSVASSIFKLASTSTANGNNILEFAKRLTGLSKVSHVTSDQLLGLASASDSLMLMPEVASTAFGKLITSLWTNYHEIEKMLGMQEDSLKGMMEKGETMKALVTVLENVSDKNLNSMDEYFKEFGSDGQRLKSVVVTMAQNVDVLKSHLQESSEAYKDGTATAKEYAIQQETAQAILERANNMWEKAFVNPQGIDAVKEMTKMWYDFSKELTQSRTFMESVKFLLWALKTSVWALLQVLPGLVALIGTRGLVAAFQKLIPLLTGLKLTGIIQFFTLLSASIKGSHIATLRLIVSWKQLSLAMKANVIGLVISAVTTLGVVMYDLFKKTDKAASSIQKFDRSFRGVESAANSAVAELDAYYNAIKRAKKGSNEYQAAMQTYTQKFGMYFKNLKRENGMVRDLEASYKAAAKAIRAKIYLQMQEDDINKQYKPRVAWSLDKLDAYGKVAPKGFDTEILKAYEEDNRNKSMGYIIQDLAKRYGSKNVSKVLAAENAGYSSAQVKKYYKDTLGDGTVHQYVRYEQLPAADQQLFSALRYIRQKRSAENHLSGVRGKYSGVQKEIAEYLQMINGDDLENLGGSNAGGSTGGGKTDKPGKGGTTENKEAQTAKTRANALIANIKAFYEEQKRKYLEWVTQMNADGEKISEGQQAQMLDYLDTRMKTALGTAKQSIATLSDGWKQFYSFMDEDVAVYDDETSKALLESIGKSDIKELHDLFEKLSGDLSRENNKTLSENLGALLDEIFANGTQQMKEAAEKLLKQQREIQKILNENDYTGAVNRETRSNFDTLGLLNPAKSVRADDKNGLQQMNKAFDDLTAKARKTVAELYRLDPASDMFRQDFLDYLSVASDGFDFASLNAQKLQALYIELIKYTDNYTEAEKRKYDAAKKIADQAWATNKINLANQDALRRMQQESNLFGKRTNMWSNLGLKDLTADPEVELMKLKMKMAEDYYAFVFANSKNQQLIDEADRTRQEAELAYANQMASAMKDRLAQMKELVNPIVTFGGEVGKAFAQMRTDVSGAQEAIKNALKSMLETWGNMALNDVNTQMWKAINDAGAKRGKANAQPGINAARANATAANAPKENLTNLGTKSNPMFVRLVDEGAPYVTQQPQSSFEGMKAQQPLGWNPDGSPITANNNGSNVVPPYAPTDANAQANPSANQGNSEQKKDEPRVWAKRNRDNANAIYEGVGDAAGSVVADAATGNGSLPNAMAGIGGSLIGGLMNTEFAIGGGNAANIPVGANGAAGGSQNGSSDDNTDAKQKKLLKKEKKHQSDLTKEVKKGVKERTKETGKGMDDIVQTTEDGNSEQTKGTELAQNAITTAITTAATTNLAAKRVNNQEVATEDAALAETETTFSMVGAVAKCFEFLGPIAGPIAAATVMATLTGLLQWALSSAFGGKKKSSSSSTNTKLVTGMLTYDSGNVQDLKPFVADNGEVYWAKEDDAPQQSGVQMLSTPTATTINGQPSLVAERGPEIVIGRETTHAMMMNNPQLLKALVNYDSNYSGKNSARRAFDNGNVAEALGASMAAGEGVLSPGASATGDMIAASTASSAALLQAVNTLLQRLNEPISAKIDMYGRGNLYDSMTKANQFMKGKM